MANMSSGLRGLNSRSSLIFQYAIALDCTMSPLAVAPVSVAVVVLLAVWNKPVPAVRFVPITVQPVGAVTGNVITIVLVPVVVAVTNPALDLLPVPMVPPVQVVAVPAGMKVSAL